MQGEPTRFDVGVAVVIAGLFGVLAFVLVGFEVFSVLLFVVPVGAPLFLGAAALGGAWLAVRGRRSARGFGAGMVVGWVLLAFWSSGLSIGVFP
ncbi:hypothetical protein [Actinophytocola oryzae]|uniref:Uncharacterized protein n=1 Tax=Actinophytocola oryzae TaxID=502181 RepID=A0A4R7VN14_9PSEU|nr:hypothetical protein [Actinophytocola oryzae]TDV50934.1 hypothetical protein CLV71_106280 [Actinophytocola oryzae]